jgi:hypothetical protein
MNRRRLRKALDHHEVRALFDAEHFAKKIGRPLNTRIHLHPGCLDKYPDDIGDFFKTFFNKLRIWSQRRGFGYHAIWVRENYEGSRREHLHVMLNVRVTRRDNTNRKALLEALDRWFPEGGAVEVDTPTFSTDEMGRTTNAGLTYILKQMTPQAWFSVGKQVRRENKDRKTGSPVGPVLGKRSGVSRTLDIRARSEENGGPRTSFPANTKPDDQHAASRTSPFPDPMKSHSHA